MDNKRYEGSFLSKPEGKELSFNSNNVEAVKLWMGSRMKENSSPAHALIVDTQDNKVIFEES